jgi:hypothetical protein
MLVSAGFSWPMLHSFDQNRQSSSGLAEYRGVPNAQRRYTSQPENDAQEDPSPLHRRNHRPSSLTIANHPLFSSHHGIALADAAGELFRKT